MDLTDEDWWRLEGLPAPEAAPPDDIPVGDEAPPEDAPAGADDPPEVEPIEVNFGEFLATHTATDDQVALLHQFITGAGDPTTIWENLLSSMMDSIALSVAEDSNPN